MLSHNKIYKTPSIDWSKRKYYYKDLPQKIQDQIHMEASFMTATEGDDLIEAQTKADKWIKENDYPKTIEHWQTRP